MTYPYKKPSSATDHVYCRLWWAVHKPQRSVSRAKHVGR